MDLDPKIKRLVDYTLKDLFSDNKWIEQVEKKRKNKIKYIFFICKFYLNSCE